MNLFVIFMTVLVVFIVLISLIIMFTKDFCYDVLQKAISVACYVNTYHYHKREVERIKIGQEKFYTSLFGERYSAFKKDKTDYIFLMLYTQWLQKPLETIPILINRNNNRVLADGENRETEYVLDKYLIELEEKYSEFATEQELTYRADIENVTIENSDD